MNIFNRYPVLIAEIGVNFYDLAEHECISNMEAAKYMIDEAKDCGITVVEFQSYNAESIVSLNDDVATESQYESLKRTDGFGVEEYRELAEYCQYNGMKFLSTPLDFESVDYLDEFMDIYKISSFDITNIPFIKYIATKNKPILLSTGASTIREIKQAVSAIEEVSFVDIAIMHSVLSFPTSYEDANLLMIKDLAENFPDYEIGYSDHTKSDENMSLLTTAYNYGANILEKHFTIDKSLPGEDHEYSMDPDDVIKFQWNVHFLSKINGKKNKQPLICETSARKEMRRSSEIDNVVGRTAKENIKEDTLIDFYMLD